MAAARSAASRLASRCWIEAGTVENSSKGATPFSADAANGEAAPASETEGEALPSNPPGAISFSTAAPATCSTQRTFSVGGAAEATTESVGKASPEEDSRWYAGCPAAVGCDAC